MNGQEILFLTLSLTFAVTGVAVALIGRKIEKKRADPSYVKKERKRRYYDFSNAHIQYQPKRKGEGYAWVAVAIIWAVFLIKMTVPALITGSLVGIGFVIKDWLQKRKIAAAADKVSMKPATPRPVETKIELAPNKPPVIVNSNVDEEDELFLFDEYEEDI